jgi:hypothetical protein
MADFNPKTAPCKIVKFNKNNPKEYETVGHLIEGQDACLQELHRLREQEPEPEKYAYYWTWLNKSEARKFAENEEDLKPRSKKRRK